jgi:purine-binding chemotaxis protein CheW
MDEQSVAVEEKKTAETAGNQQAGKYLTFKLADEEYGLEILKVKEIIGLMNITKVPRTPDHIRGVINLRGKVIPVMDLRSKFGMEKTADTNETCIIVVDVARDNFSVLMGILVDSVSEVLDIDGQEIEDAPSFGTDINTDFILGMGKAKDRVIILLDIDKVMDTEELKLVESAAGEKEDKTA